MYLPQYNDDTATHFEVSRLKHLYPDRFSSLPYSLNTWREEVSRHYILGEPNDVDTITAEFLIAAVDKLKELIKDGYICKTALSFGKDSSVLCLILLLALMELKQEGFKPKHRAIVTHGSTLVEIPTVDTHAKENWNQLTKFALLYDLEVDFVLAKPSFTSSWIGRVVTGRGLPTTVASNVRQCTNDLKINPMGRAVKRYFKNKGIDSKNEKILLLLGSRDSESKIRKSSIAKHGGQEDPLAVTKLDSGESVSYLIKNFSTGMVWEVLQFAGLDEGKILPSYKLSYDDTVRIYADSSGECVLFDTSEKSKQTQQPCGARHGCVTCLAVGNEDKAMRNFLANEEYAYMRPLNRIREFLAKTHWDWGQRSLVNRSIDPWGFCKVQEDLYSFEKCKRLFWALVSCDAMEEDRAYEHSKRYFSDDSDMERSEYNRRMCEPQFKFVTFKDAVLVDFLWAFHSFADEPNTALNIWYKVYEQGRYETLAEVDDMPFVPRTPQPEARYLYVGESWSSKLDVNLMGIRDPILEVFADECPGVGLEARLRTNKVTKQRETFFSMEVNEGQELDISEEALEILESDLKYYAHRTGYGPSDASIRMLRDGSIQIARGKQSSYQNMMERAQFFQYLGINSHTTLADIEARSDLKLFTKEQHQQFTRFIPSKKAAIERDFEMNEGNLEHGKATSVKVVKPLQKSEFQMGFSFESEFTQESNAPVKNTKPQKTDVIETLFIDASPVQSEKQVLIEQMTFW
ncbi:hypothetical protein HUO09_17335 [Vibrio sp. Y2-5]|uniref:hypothetical protein n=1 Tax=Vibrio sp. Y2-5 TaxID=2743977 RepID=UPI001660202A|nr:hypothetical protein [Vibrio sp. Y2-5]MBD0788120.1 hypothetical protein [Vibrio sp. Y2-5]